MSSLSALGTQAYQPSALPAHTQPTPPGTTPAQSVGNALTTHAVTDPVALSSTGINLSQKALADRVDQLGSDTIDVAQQFLNSFASQLFGKAADGASISFDSASISAESSFAGIVESSSGPNGSSKGAAFSLSESSHFVGKGQITTTDGQRFDFEIDVKYTSKIEAAAVQNSSNSAGANDAGGAVAPSRAASTQPNDGNALPTKQLPAIDFPGSLADLFKLLGRDLHSQPQADAAPANPDQGSLSLRLLKLVNSASLIDSTAPDAATSAQNRNKALAGQYTSLPAPISLTPDSPASNAA